MIGRFFPDVPLWELHVPNRGIMSAKAATPELVAVQSGTIIAASEAKIKHRTVKNVLLLPPFCHPTTYFVSNG